MTFHNGEKDELKDVIKHIKPETIQPIGNHPQKLQHIKTKLETPCKSMWDPTKIKRFGIMRSLWQVHMPKRVKLINSRSELMNCVGFRGKTF